VLRRPEVRASNQLPDLVALILAHFSEYEADRSHVDRPSANYRVLRIARAGVLAQESHLLHLPTIDFGARNRRDGPHFFGRSTKARSSVSSSCPLPASISSSSLRRRGHPS
jgi:hypothetical protein